MKLYDNIEDDFKKFILGNDALFHYTRYLVALEKILFAKSFKLSSFKNTNDPYEYSHKLRGAVGWGWDDIIEEKVHETKITTEKVLTEQTLFVSCCSNEFDKGILKSHGYLKSRMWSQYGENHKGICLVFSKEKLLNLLPTIFKTTDYVIFNGAVEYAEAVNNGSKHTILNIDKKAFDENTPYNIAIQHVERYHRELLFRKQLDYKDELEYRIVVLCKKRNPFSAAEPGFRVKDCLRGIILGDRFPKLHHPTVKNICLEMNLSSKKLLWHSGKFFLIAIK